MNNMYTRHEMKCWEYEPYITLEILVTLAMKLLAS
jgi:hypothetical protein